MPRLINFSIDLDAADLATLVAALWYWRDSKGRPEKLEYIACGFGAFRMLDGEQIEALIGRLSDPTDHNEE